MGVFNQELKINTKGKGTYEITDSLENALMDSGLSDGLATIFVGHTSCSLVLMENADPSARVDLERFMDDLVPDDYPHFIHTMEGPDDMPSHIRMCLTDVDKNVPIIGGQMVLGTWQGLFLFEHRRAPHTRNIAVSVFGE